CPCEECVLPRIFVPRLTDGSNARRAFSLLSIPRRKKAGCDLCHSGRTVGWVLRSLFGPHAAESCHLDRLRGSVATKEEWRDPDDMSSATAIRGVLTKRLLLNLCRARLGVTADSDKDVGELPESGWIAQASSGSLHSHSVASLLLARSR